MLKKSNNFFNKEFWILIGLIIGVPSIILVMFYYGGHLEWGIGLAGALFGSFFTFIGAHYTNYHAKNQFIEEKKYSKDLLVEEINLGKKQKAIMEFNKEITKIFDRSGIVSKPIHFILQELLTMDDIIIFFPILEKESKSFKQHSEYSEVFYGYIIEEIGDELYKYFKKEIKNLNNLLYLSPTLKDEIICWANNYEVVKSTKKDLKDSLPYKRYDDYYQYPLDMTYKALYYDLKIICSIIWRDTNAFLYNNIPITKREEINSLFDDEVEYGERYKYIVSSYDELGEELIIKDIYKTLFKELYPEIKLKIKEHGKIDDSEEIDLEEEEEKVVDEKMNELKKYIDEEIDKKINDFD